MNKSYVNKKSQFTIEFVILIAFMFIIFVGFFAIVSYRLIEEGEEEKQKIIENIATLVENEIKLAKTVKDGYNRTFKIPRKINGNDYAIEIKEDRELVVNYSGYEYVLFLPENVKGDVNTGLNEIAKIDGIVYLRGVEMPCNNGIDDDVDTYTDSADPDCYEDCDYLTSGKYMPDWPEDDSCDCSHLGGTCCSDWGLGVHYTRLDAGCGTAECWSICLPFGKLIMKSSLEDIISFDNDGNVLLNGTLKQGQSSINPAPGQDEFIFKDITGDVVAMVRLQTGNMFIGGSLFENGVGWVNPDSGNNNFIVKANDGEVVSYIDDSGDFYLKGGLTERGNP